MASITRVVEIKNHASIDERFVRRHVRIYRVHTDDPLMDALAATNTSLLPSMYSSYSTSLTSDRGATLRDISAERDDNDPKIWIVTCSYSNERRPLRASEHLADVGGGAGGGGSGGSSRGSETEQNPLLRVPDVQFGAQKYQEPYERDYYGKPVLLASGERPDPMPMRDKTRQTITVTRNEPGFNARVAREYFDTLNDRELRVAGNRFPTATLKVDSITGTLKFENNYLFYTITYSLSVLQPETVDRVLDAQSPTLLFSESVSGWDQLILNAGYRQVNAAGQLIDILIEGTGAAPSKPWLLDENGRAYSAQAAANTDNAIYLEFRPYRRRDLRALALPPEGPLPGEP